MKFLRSCVWSDASQCNVQGQNCIEMLQSGAFEKSAQKYNNKCMLQGRMEEECHGESFQLLVLVRCFTVKSYFIFRRTGEYCRIACFPQMKNDPKLFFNKTMLLSKLQRQPRNVLRTSTSGSCFDLVRVQI